MSVADGLRSRLRDAMVKSDSRVPTARTRSASAASALAAAPPVTPIAPTLQGMVPRECALSGLGLGHRHAVARREIGEPLAGERVMHPAAGNDQRRASAQECGCGIGELS